MSQPDIHLNLSRDEFQILINLFAATCERGALKATEAFNFGFLFNKLEDQAKKSVEAAKAAASAPPPMSATPAPAPAGTESKQAMP